MILWQSQRRRSELELLRQSPRPDQQAALARQLGVALEGAGVTITPFDLPAVIAARRLYADTVAQMPMVALRDRQAKDPQPSLLARPDPAEPRWLTLHRLVNNLTRHGLGWILTTARDSHGYPLACRVLDTGATTTQHSPDGGLIGAWHHGRPIPHHDLLAVPYNVDRVATGELVGSSPVEDAREVLEAFASLYCMAGSFWKAGYPSLAVTTKQRLSETQAQALKAQLIGAWSQTHVPAVLDGDATVAALGASAQEAQLVDSLAVVVAEVARVFQVPPSLLNAPVAASLTYATTETEFRRWLATGLQPMLMRIEAAFSDLLPYGTSARFDTSELQRGDFTARAQGYAVALGGQPWLLVDEVRGKEGLEPMPAGSSSSSAAPATDPGLTAPATVEAGA